MSHLVAEVDISFLGEFHVKTDLSLNLPFIYRSLVESEVRLRSGNAPCTKNSLIVGLPKETHSGFHPCLALRIDDVKIPLGQFLKMVKEDFIDKGLSFPLLLTPSPDWSQETSLNDVYEYLLVYDFSEKKMRGLVQTRVAKLKQAKSITVKPFLISELNNEILNRLILELSQYTQYDYSFWERITIDVDEENISGFIAVDNNEVNAFAFYEWFNFTFRLIALYTLEEHRGRGAGETLLQSVLEEAQKLGAILISSILPESHPFAYYLGKYGFSEIVSISAWYPPSRDFFKEG